MSAWEQDVAPVLAGFNPPGETPQLREAVLAEVATMVRDYIVAGWPVATGLSIAGWRTRGSVVYNDVEYVPYVRDGLADRLWEEAKTALGAKARARYLSLIAVKEGPSGTRGPLALRRRSAGGQAVAVSVRDSRTGELPPARAVTAPAPLRPVAAAAAPTATGRQIAAAVQALAPYTVGADVLAFVQAGRVEDALRLLTRQGNARAATALRAAVRR